MPLSKPLGKIIKISPHVVSTVFIELCKFCKGAFDINFDKICMLDWPNRISVEKAGRSEPRKALVIDEQIFFLIRRFLWKSDIKAKNSANIEVNDCSEKRLTIFWTYNTDHCNPVNFSFHGWNCAFQHFRLAWLTTWWLILWLKTADMMAFMESTPRRQRLQLLASGLHSLLRVFFSFRQPVLLKLLNKLPLWSQLPQQRESVCVDRYVCTGSLASLVFASWNSALKWFSFFNTFPT